MTWCTFRVFLSSGPFSFFRGSPCAAALLEIAKPVTSAAAAPVRRVISLLRLHVFGLRPAQSSAALSYIQNSRCARASNKAVCMFPWRKTRQLLALLVHPTIKRAADLLSRAVRRFDDERLSAFTYSRFLVILNQRAHQNFV